MSQKSIPMSVRLSEDDAAFIAGLDIQGATTPSDKLRALVAEARERSEARRDYGKTLTVVRGMIDQASHEIRSREHDQGVHSEVIGALLTWLPEALAYVMTHAADEAGEGNDAGLKALTQLEAGVADRVVVLMEAMLRLAVTSRCRAYEPSLWEERLAGVLDLAILIRDRSVR